MLADDPVANGNHHIQVVVSNLALYLTFALLANYPEIPDSCCRRVVHTGTTAM